MARTEKAVFEPMRSVAFGAITNAFLPLGTPTTVPARFVVLNNLTNGIIQVSVDGVNVHFQLAPGSSKLLQLTNNGYADSQLYLSAATQFYVRFIGAAPATQSFWIELMGARTAS